MPLHPCQLENGDQGWRLGHSGPCYKTKKEAMNKLANAKQDNEQLLRKEINKQLDNQEK